MNRQVFNESWGILVNAFPNADRITAETQAIYWTMLKDIPEDIWTQGISSILANSTFFPTIHDLGVACFGETIEHQEERCDPLKFKQNYTVTIEAVSWQENMQIEIESRQKALKPPERTQLPTKPNNSEDYRNTDRGKEWLRGINAVAIGEMSLDDLLDKMGQPKP